ncbi:MAG: hypothetical protein VR67_03620 [Peptococcaceae bacterium BRH_c8a]|nr:MAG: hypothetical protein VR67_03620 [Peptococcaceae bacterium BRH_c8a]
MEERKNKLIAEFESLRQDRVNNGIAYEKQLELERQGTIEAIQVYLSQEKSKFDFSEYMALIGDALSCWKRISGKANDLKGLIEFYKSEYYKNMPYNDIKAKLYARIITDRNPIETGDSMDVANISSMAPYCNMILTDKKMRNRIYDLSIHINYDVNIFSLKNYDELMDYIQAI